MPSSKMTVTCDRPNFEIERTSCRPGSPEIACSTGTVICRSTSCGDSAGATGVDLHLHRRRVGEGVDRQPREREHAGDGERESADQHREAVAERPGDDGVEHATFPRARRFDLAAAGADALLQGLGLEQEAADRRHVFARQRGRRRPPPARPFPARGGRAASRTGPRPGARTRADTPCASLDRGPRHGDRRCRSRRSGSSRGRTCSRAERRRARRAGRGRAPCACARRPRGATDSIRPG